MRRLVSPGSAPESCKAASAQTSKSIAERLHGLHRNVRVTLKKRASRAQERSYRKPQKITKQKQIEMFLIFVGEQKRNPTGTNWFKGKNL